MAKSQSPQPRDPARLKESPVHNTTTERRRVLALSWRAAVYTSALRGRNEKELPNARHPDRCGVPGPVLLQRRRGGGGGRGVGEDDRPARGCHSHLMGPYSHLMDSALSPAPIPDTHSQPPDALHTPNACREIPI